MEKLFSYGTLQLENVQKDTFSRILIGSKEILMKYVIEHIKITDQKVILSSGTDIHPILKYVVINNDSKIGILDTSYFCIMGKEKVNLYKYKNKDKTDYFDKESEKALEMTEYAKSLMQTYQEMLLNGEITLNKK